jgi:hypothetical protein
MSVVANRIAGPGKDPASCLCSHYKTESGQTTGCTSVTPRRFAPGHDAKLKSFLIKAGADGQRVVNTVSQETRSAIAWAEMFGYDGIVTGGIDREVARRQAKALSGIKVTPTRSRLASTDDVAATVAKAEQEYADEQRRLVQERQASAEW